MTRLRRRLCRVLGHQDEPCEWTAAPRIKKQRGIIYDLLVVIEAPVRCRRCGQ